MPSPRSSPALRPSSPLSPGYKGSAGHFDTLQPPSPRTMHGRAAANNSRRVNNASLKLPSLPRFHPANFPSAHTSVQTTPDGVASPHGPMSPRAHQRMVSDAQKHLFMYQREQIVSAARASSPTAQVDKPTSPRLAPMGSPGPVTPLELGGEEGYLVAGARSSAVQVEMSNSEDLVERLIREEARRQRQRSSQSLSRSTDR